LPGVEDLVVEPVPAYPGDFEFKQEIERNALVERVLERRVERNSEVGLEKIALFSCDQRGAVDIDALGLRRRRR